MSSKEIYFSSINVGLDNTLSAIHPPTYYYFILTVLVVFLINKLLTLNPVTNTRRILYSIRGNYVYVFSIMLSCWWATQELFWGDFWNWDPVEMSAVFLFISIAHIIHQNHNRGGDVYYQLTSLHCANVVILFVLYHNKSYLAQSVHLFSTSFLFKVEFSLVKIALTWVIIYLVLLRKGDLRSHPNFRLALVAPILAYIFITLVVALSEVLVFTRANATHLANVILVLVLLNCTKALPVLEIPSLFFANRYVVQSFTQVTLHKTLLILVVVFIKIKVLSAGDAYIECLQTPLSYIQVGDCEVRGHFGKNIKQYFYQTRWGSFNRKNQAILAHGEFGTQNNVSVYKKYKNKFFFLKSECSFGTYSLAVLLLILLLITYDREVKVYPWCLLWCTIRR